MGVKSTVTLTPTEAVEKYAELTGDMRNLRLLDAAAMLATDPSKLERRLEELNDAAHGGEGFENYIITREKS